MSDTKKQIAELMKQSPKADEFVGEIVRKISSGSTIIFVRMRDSDERLYRFLSSMRGKGQINRPNSTIYSWNCSGSLEDYVLRKALYPESPVYQEQVSDPAVQRDMSRWRYPSNMSDPSQVIQWFCQPPHRSSLSNDISERSISPNQGMNQGFPLLGSILIMSDAAISIKDSDGKFGLSDDSLLARTIRNCRPVLHAQRKIILFPCHENLVSESLSAEFDFIDFPTPEPPHIVAMMESIGGYKITAAKKRKPNDSGDASQEGSEEDGADEENSEDQDTPQVHKPETVSVAPIKPRQDPQTPEVVRLLAGMSEIEIRQALRESNRASAFDWLSLDERKRPNTRSFDQKSIQDFKLARLRDLGNIEVIEPAFGLDAIGGLESLKRDLDRDLMLFDPEARNIGLGYPKGYMLVGPGGTGKSQIAKAISKHWNLPAYRLDIGACKDKWVGASEKNMRKALERLDALAPCISGDTKILVTPQSSNDGIPVEVSAEELWEKREELLPGNVETIDEQGNRVMAEILGIVERNNTGKDMVEIIDIEGNSITVTENHKLLAVGDDEWYRWVSARDIKPWTHELIRLEGGEVTLASLASVRGLDPVDKVYDLLCSEPHSYPTNGFISHNCVAFLDEFEKMWAGTGGPSTDGGTTQNMVATFLSWSQEKKSPVFVLAAANSVEGIPSPMLRAGRFDRVYFVPLPSPEAREEIFKIHLRKRGWDPEEIDVDLKSFAKETDKYSGAEIEQIVIEAIKSKAARSLDRGDPITEEDFEEALARVTPIVRSHPESYREIESWASMCGAIDAAVGSKIKKRIARKGKKAKTEAEPQGDDLEVEETLF